MTVLRALAAAQTIPMRGDVAANVVQHIQLTRLAAEAGARVLIFPELSLTGYELDLAAELSFSEKDARLTPLFEVASATSITLIVGAPIRVDDKLHLGAFIIYPDGRLAIHTKCFLGEFSRDEIPDGVLPPAERAIFECGTLNPLVTLGDQTAALALCAESLQPGTPKEAKARGAQTYLTSHFSMPIDRERRLSAFRAYAARYQMAVVFSNYGGPTAGLPASGGSAILSQTGELLAQLPASGAGVVAAIESAQGWSARSLALSSSS